ncbi:MAG: type II toxin-antitoxin system PemK/MazF family toxin [Streptosporangiaceae bacterium]
MPGNVFVPAAASGLAADSVVNVTALVTVDKADLDPAIGQLPGSVMHEVDRGLRRILGFWQLVAAAPPHGLARHGSPG